MARQLAITKRTTLDGFDGWDSECYVEWRPITYTDSLKLKTTDVGGDEAKAFETIFGMVKDHIIGGKVRVVGEDGKPVLVDYESDDLDNMPPAMVNRIFADLTGAQFEDPKDSQAAQPSNDEQPKSESTSETPSSEA